MKSREGEQRVMVDGASLGKRFRDAMRDGRNGKTLGELREDMGLRYVRQKRRLEKVEEDWGQLVG